MTMIPFTPTRWIGQRINDLDVLVGFHEPSRTLTHLAIDDTTAPFAVGTLIKAKVTGYNAGFKAFDMTWNDYRFLLKAPHTQYSGGETVTVQVESLPDEESKVPVVTTDIRLSGYHVIVLPHGKGVHFSSAIAAEKRDGLAVHIAQDCPYGMIIRSNAYPDKINEEVNNIILLYNNFKQSDKDVFTPYAGAVRDVLLSDYMDGTLLVTDRDFMSHDFSQWAQNTLPNAAITIQDEPFETDDIFALFEPLTGDTLYIDNNTTIVFETGCTLTAIDINHAGKESPLTVNLAVADHLANQIPLRGISGMVVIDFLRMNNQDERKKLENCFHQCLPADFSIRHYGFTRMGLYEMTVRKRHGRIKSHLLRICDK